DQHLAARTAPALPRQGAPRSLNPTTRRWCSPAGDFRLWHHSPTGTRRVASQGGHATRATIGDRLIIKGHHVGERGRKARVLEVHGDNDAPPWLVRWNDDDHENPFFGPG